MKRLSDGNTPSFHLDMDGGRGIIYDANFLAELCHSLAYNAGWWDEPEVEILEEYLDTVGSGELPEAVSGLIDKYELARDAKNLALIHSEVSEALEGVRKGKMDDHLLHRSAEEVELADALIRIFDYAGHKKFDIGGAMVEKLCYNKSRVDHKRESRKGSLGKKF